MEVFFTHHFQLSMVHSVLPAVLLPHSQSAASISPCFIPLPHSSTPLSQLPSHFPPESFRFHWYSLSVPSTYQSVLRSHSLHHWQYRSRWLSDQSPTVLSVSQLFVAPVLRCMGNFLQDTKEYNTPLSELTLAPVALVVLYALRDM